MDVSIGVDDLPVVILAGLGMQSWNLLLLLCTCNNFWGVDADIINVLG